MKERLEPARARFVRRIEPQHRQIGVSRLIDHPAQPGCCRRVDVLDVDALVGANWQCCWARVRCSEPDYRGPLCGLTLSREVCATDGGYRAVDAEEWLIEQREHELLPQQPAHRLVDAVLADPPGTYQF